MSERERLRREDPARTEPIRNWSNLYRAANSWNAEQARTPGNSADGAARNGAGNDAVEHGVRTGYRVIEEHIREIRRGEGIAREMNRGPYESRGISDDILDVVERVYRYSRELLPVWFDLAGSIAKAPELLRELTNPPRRESEARTEGSAASEPIAVEILSNRLTRVTIELRPNSEGRALGVRELHAMEPGKPPIVGVNFVAGSAGVVLRILVPDEHPPGVYNGVIADLESGEARGTVSVRIHER
jgi:hypothetical protein